LQQTISQAAVDAGGVAAAGIAMAQQQVKFEICRKNAGQASAIQQLPQLTWSGLLH